MQMIYFKVLINIFRNITMVWDKWYCATAIIPRYLIDLNLFSFWWYICEALQDQKDGWELFPNQKENFQYSE